MSKLKWWLLLSALLLVAASASAQPPACDRDCNPAPARKVWRDADLRKPLPASLSRPSADVLAGLKARQFDAGFVGELQPKGGTYYPPDPEVVRELRRERRLPRSSAVNDFSGSYASQPLYPFFYPPYPVYSQRPLWPVRRPQASGRKGGGR